MFTNLKGTIVFYPISIALVDDRIARSQHRVTEAAIGLAVDEAIHKIGARNRAHLTLFFLVELHRAWHRMHHQSLLGENALNLLIDLLALWQLGLCMGQRCLFGLAKFGLLFVFILVLAA